VLERVRVRALARAFIEQRLQQRFEVAPAVLPVLHELQPVGSAGSRAGLEVRGTAVFVEHGIVRPIVMNEVGRQREVEADDLPAGQGVRGIDGRHGRKPAGHIDEEAAAAPVRVHDPLHELVDLAVPARDGDRRYTAGPRLRQQAREQRPENLALKHRDVRSIEPRTGHRPEHPLHEGTDVVARNGERRQAFDDGGGKPTAEERLVQAVHVCVMRIHLSFAEFDDAEFEPGNAHTFNSCPFAVAYSSRPSVVKPALIAGVPGGVTRRTTRPDASSHTASGAGRAKPSVSRYDAPIDRPSGDKLILTTAYFSARKRRATDAVCTSTISIVPFAPPITRFFPSAVNVMAKVVSSRSRRDVFC
jgi:hypothetical protein